MAAAAVAAAVPLRKSSFHPFPLDCLRRLLLLLLLVLLLSHQITVQTRSFPDTAEIDTKLLDFGRKFLHTETLALEKIMDKGTHETDHPCLLRPFQSSISTTLSTAEHEILQEF